MGDLILICDDDAELLELYELVLGDLPFGQLTSKNGKEALRLYNENPGRIRVILTDLHMPIMSGLQLLEALDAQKSTTPVVVLSGFGDAHNRQEAKRLGAYGFLDKPCEPADLCALIMKAAAEKAA